MRRPRVIGIVGGVGPYAGTDLLNKVFSQTPASADQEHLPVILISMPHLIPDRTEYLLGRAKKNPAGAIYRVIRELERAGASVIGIPCNTAHSPMIFGKLKTRLRRAGSRAKLLNMIEEVAAHTWGLAPFSSSRKRRLSPFQVGLLATTGTCRSGVYEDVFSRRGIGVLLPARRVQEKFVHPAIYDRRYGIKARSSPVSPRARAAVRKAMDALVAAGADAIILGCTELPLAYGKPAYRGRPVIDSTLVLARALVREATEKALGTGH